MGSQDKCAKKNRQESLAVWIGCCVVTRYLLPSATGLGKKKQE